MRSGNYSHMDSAIGGGHIDQWSLDLLHIFWRQRRSLPFANDLRLHKVEPEECHQESARNRFTLQHM
jgi:hypothetical protein